MIFLAIGVGIVILIILAAYIGIIFMPEPTDVPPVASKEQAKLERQDRKAKRAFDKSLHQYKRAARDYPRDGE